VFDAGSGAAYDAWSHWRDDPSPVGAVAAAILAANPHNIQPWIFHVGTPRVGLVALVIGVPVAVRSRASSSPAVSTAPFDREWRSAVGQDASSARSSAE